MKRLSAFTARLRNSGPCPVTYREIFRRSEWQTWAPITFGIASLFIIAGLNY